MSDQVQIREAELTDYFQVNTLFTEELAYHIAIQPDLFQMCDPVMTREWYKDELNNKVTVLFVAEMDQLLVGLIQVMLRHNPSDPVFKLRTYAHIEELFVSESQRSKGIGRSLMQTAQQWAKERGASEIDLWVWENNETAISFYKRMGYGTIRQAMGLRLE